MNYLSLSKSIKPNQYESGLIINHKADEALIIHHIHFGPNLAIKIN